MSAEKVLSLYDSDRMESGWKPPFCGFRKLDLAREAETRRQLIAQANADVNKNSAIFNELNMLEAKTSAIQRSLSDLEPKRTGKDLRTEYNIGRQLNSVSKPSIRDQKKKIVPENQVNRLTAEQMAVLMDPNYSTLNNNSENRISLPEKGIGKLTPDMLSVLGTEESNRERKTSAPGKLTSDQMSVLARGNLGEEGARGKGAVGKLSLRPDESKANERKLRQQQRQQQKQSGLRKTKSEFVDMELDDMLSQLDHDSEFQSLTDNEKMAWLESLFFLDTGPSPRRSLQKVEGNPNKNTLSINKSASACSFPEPSTTPPSRSVIPRSRSPPPAKKPSELVKQEKKLATESNNQIPGVNVNNNLVSLAQSFFANDPSSKNTKKKSVTSANAVPKPFTATQPSAFPVSGTAARSNTHPHNKPNNLAVPKVTSDHVKLTPSPTSPIPERAFFEPSSPGQNRAMVKEESPEFGAPPIPTRTNLSKSSMLRLMSNATSIMKQ